MQQETNRQENNLIRTMVRGTYDLQKIRIQMGNRVTANFKAKLGLSPDGMSEKELEKQEKKVLELLRASYRRITDGIVEEGSDVIQGKLPTARKFKGDELISTFTELVLVDQYMTLLRDEEKQFASLTKVLSGIPIYDEFLEHVKGIGPAMAGIIISEIDIHRAEYPSSLWKYAGLDVVIVGSYVDADGKTKTVGAAEVDAFYADGDYDKKMLAEGKYEIIFNSVGRSRKEYCLVQRQYEAKDGTTKTRNSITYNPFLKTKLIGVLATSFLRSGTATVDGKKMGAARRLELAKTKGFSAEDYNDDEVDVQAEAFLRKQGHVVVVEPSPYARCYYDYKNRLENSPHHKEKSDGHRHAMALRFMVKRFLATLYKEWRTLEGLPVAPEYAEGVLGKVHGEAKEVGWQQHPRFRK